MDDLISRQAAIDVMCRALHYNYEEGYAVTQMLAIPSAKSNLQPTCNQLATDPSKYGLCADVYEPDRLEAEPEKRMHTERKGDQTAPR